MERVYNTYPEATELPKIEKMVLQGLQVRMSDVFGVKNPTFISTNDRALIAEKLSKLSGGEGKVTYPWCFFHIDSVDFSTSQTPAKPLARQGMYIANGDNTKTLTRIHPTATVFEVEVFWITDDFWDALDFVARWGSARNNARLNFTLNYGKAPIDVGVQLGPNLQTPNRDIDVNTPTYYEYMGNLTVQGYMSSTHRDDVETVAVIDHEKHSIKIGSWPVQEFNIITGEEWNALNLPKGSDGNNQSDVPNTPVDSNFD